MSEFESDYWRDGITCVKKIEPHSNSYFELVKKLKSGKLRFDIIKTRIYSKEV